MVVDMYTEGRHATVHGAVARPRTRNHGLVAGCAFAKDILRASMAPIKTECLEVRPRDYVDDITLRVGGDTTIECAAKLHALLQRLKCALRKDSMALDDGQQQVLGLSHGEVTQIAKDLGGTALRLQCQAPICGCAAHQGCKRVSTTPRHDDGFGPIWKMPVRIGMRLRYQEADPEDAQDDVRNHGG